MMLLLAILAITSSAVAASPVEVKSVIVGFENSECARYDAVRDEYLVSNRTGADLTSGYVTRVAPDGRIVDRYFIRDGQRGVELKEPFGIALHRDAIYVADRTQVRIFDRNSGAPIRSIAIPGAVRLNDLTVTADGTILVTDSAADDLPGAIWRIRRSGRITAFARPDFALERPNGIAVTNAKEVVHGGRGVNLVYRTMRGRIARERTLPRGRIDGIVSLADGSLLVASQDAHDVYLVPPKGAARTVASEIPVPAAIGYDTRRRRLLIPQIRLGTLTIVDLPSP